MTKTHLLGMYWLMKAKTTTKTIDLTPSWQAAARIYMAVLRNPDASFSAITMAESEILRLAKHVDDMQAKNRKEAA